MTFFLALILLVVSRSQWPPLLQGLAKSPRNVVDLHWAIVDIDGRAGNIGICRVTLGNTATITRQCCFTEY